MNKLAYERLKSKPGNMTPGVNSETRVAAVSPYGFYLKHVERGLREKYWLGKALDRALFAPLSIRAIPGELIPKPNGYLRPAGR